MKFTYKLNISTEKLNGMLNKARKEELDKKKMQIKAFRLLILAIDDGETCGLINSMDEIFPDCTEKEKPKNKTPLHKTNFKVGDSVKFLTTKGDLVSGKVLKIYESTFGAKVRDTALQIKLDSPYLGRGTTTVRAIKCKAFEKSPFFGKFCGICKKPAIAHIFSKKRAIDEYYCKACYDTTKALLPLNKKDDLQIKG